MASDLGKCEILIKSKQEHTTPCPLETVRPLQWNMQLFSDKAARLGISCWSWLIVTLPPSFTTILLSKVYRAVLSTKDDNLGMFSGLRGDDSHSGLRPQLVSPPLLKSAFPSSRASNGRAVGLVEQFVVHNELLSFFKECSGTITDVSQSFGALHEVSLGSLLL